MSNNKVFIPFACCIPVMGYSRSIIYDLNRITYDYIPNDLAKIILQYTGKSKDEILKDFSEDEETIIEYFNFLEDNEYIFYVDKQYIKQFPPLSDKWINPSAITNAIIDSNNSYSYDIITILQNLSSIGCEYIQYRQIDYYSYSDIDVILQALSTSQIINIELYIPYISDNIINELSDLIDKYKRLGNVYIYNAPRFSISQIGNSLLRSCIWMPENININLPIQDINYFTPTTSLYTESLHFNNYLNRKVYISTKGEIKNAPEQVKNFGNVKETNLLDVIRTDSFQSLWYVKKDIIAICKDCEYRYACVDGRMPKKIEGSNFWKFESSCSYNPYMCKWKYEKGYIPAEEMGKYNQKYGFTPHKL